MADPEIEAILADMRATMVEFRTETEAVSQQLEADRRADAANRAEVEQARRDGKHGAEWRAVQQSIDLGKTTLDDVISGVDLSAEAKALRAIMQATLPAARAQFATVVESQQEEGDLAKLHAAQAELATALEQLNRLNSNI
jgi:hypothetical protein